MTLKKRKASSQPASCQLIFFLHVLSLQLAKARSRRRRKYLAGSLYIFCALREPHCFSTLRHQLCNNFADYLILICDFIEGAPLFRLYFLSNLPLCVCHNLHSNFLFYKLYQSSGEKETFSFSLAFKCRGLEESFVTYKKAQYLM